MATKVAQKRLQKEYINMERSPPPFIWACPEERDILNWHFIIRGPPDSPYAGGEYHGLIWFPSDYPFKPPDVKFFTPSGRFAVGQKICMSMTSYHPSTWNAAWSVATILTGLLSFMLGNDVTAGSVRTTDEEKRALARQSHAFNLASKKFKEIFPKYATPEMTDLPDMGVPPAPSSSTTTAPTPDRAALSPISSPSSASTSGASSPSPTPVPAVPSDHAHTGAAPQSQSTSAGVGPLKKRNPAVGNGRWIPSWRWVVAGVILAVVGRLSALASR